LVATYTGIEWKVTSLHDAIQKDQETFKQPGILLHELTFSILLKEMLPVMVEVLKKSKDIILHKQKHYWQIKEYLLFEYCRSRQFENTIRKIIEVNDEVKELEKKRKKLDV
jgi:hypothetical protein